MNPRKEVTNLTEVVKSINRVIRIDTNWKKFVALQKKLSSATTIENITAIRQEIRTFIDALSLIQETQRIDNTIQALKETFEEAKKQVSDERKRLADKLINIDLKTDLDFSENSVTLEKILRGNYPGLIEAIATQNIEELNEFANRTISGVDFNQSPNFKTALANIADNKEFQDFNAFIQSIPDSYYNSFESLIFGAHATDKLLPSEFLKQYEMLIDAKRKELEQKKPTPQNPVNRGHSFTDVKPPQIDTQQRRATSPEDKKPEQNAASSPVVNQEPATSTATLENAFLNYKLRELLPNANQRLIEEINGAILDNNNKPLTTALNELKKTKEGKKEAEQVTSNLNKIYSIDKQIRYYSQIINPAIVTLLGGSAYLKSTKKNYLGKISTAKQITAINQTIMDASNSDDAIETMRKLLQDIGIGASDDQITEIIRNNDALRNKVEAEAAVNKKLSSDKEKLAWLEQNKKTINPSYFSPPSHIAEQLDHFIKSSLGNLVIKHSMWTEEEHKNIISSLATAILDNLTAVYKSLNLSDPSAFKMQCEKAIKAYCLNQKKDVTVSGFIKEVIRRANILLEPSVVDNLTKKTIEELASDKHETIFKGQFNNIELYSQKENDGAYKILSDIIDNNLLLPEYIKNWEVAVLLRSINVDTPRLLLLGNKLIKKTKNENISHVARDLLKDLYDRNANLSLYINKEYELLSSIELAMKMSPEEKIKMWDAFLTRQKNILEKQQKEVTNKLNEIKGEIGFDVYKEHIDAMEAELFNFNAILTGKDPKLNNLEQKKDLAKNLATTDPKEHSKTAEINLMFTGGGYAITLKEKTKKDLPSFATKEEKEKHARLVDKAIEFDFQLIADMSKNLKTILNRIYDPDGKLTTANLKLEKSSKGVASYENLNPDLDEDKKQLLDFFLIPFKRLSEIKFPSTENVSDKTAFFKEIANQFKGDPELKFLMIDSLNNQGNLDVFCAKSNIDDLEIDQNTHKKMTECSSAPLRLITKSDIALQDVLKNIFPDDPAYQFAKEAYDLTKSVLEQANKKNATEKKEDKEKNASPLQETKKDLIESINEYKSALDKKAQALNFTNKEAFIGEINKLAKVADTSDLASAYKIKIALAVLSKSNSADEMLSYVATKSASDSNLFTQLADTLKNQGAQVTSNATSENKPVQTNVAPVIKEPTQQSPNPYGSAPPRNPQDTKAKIPETGAYEHKAVPPTDQSTHSTNLGSKEGFNPMPKWDHDSTWQAFSALGVGKQVKKTATPTQATLSPGTTSTNSQYDRIVQPPVEIDNRAHANAPIQQNIASLLEQMMVALDAMKTPLEQMQRHLNQGHVVAGLDSNSVFHHTRPQSEQKTPQENSKGFRPKPGST